MSCSLLRLCPNLFSSSISSYKVKQIMYPDILSFLIPYYGYFIHTVVIIFFISLRGSIRPLPKKIRPVLPGISGLMEGAVAGFEEFSGFHHNRPVFGGGCLQWFMSSGGTASAGRQEVIMGWGLPGFKRCPACRSCPIDGGSPVRLFAFNGPRLLCRSGSGPDHAMTHGYRHHEGMKGCEDKKASGGRDARGIPAI